MDGEETMSDAIEAAAKAILGAQQARGGTLPGEPVRWEHKSEAEAALLAALPAFTEGLAEVIADARMKHIRAWERFQDEPFSNPDPGTIGDYIAAAVTAHLERQVRG